MELISKHLMRAFLWHPWIPSTPKLDSILYLFRFVDGMVESDSSFCANQSEKWIWMLFQSVVDGLFINCSFLFLDNLPNVSLSSVIFNPAYIGKDNCRDVLS